MLPKNKKKTTDKDEQLNMDTRKELSYLAAFAKTIISRK